MLPIIKRAATIVGKGIPNYSELARRIGAPRTGFYIWRRVPTNYCQKIVKATGGELTLHQIRPDVYTKDM